MPYKGKGSSEWHQALNINSGSKADSAYQDELDSNEITIYIGQAWASTNHLTSLAGVSRK